MNLNEVTDIKNGNRIIGTKYDDYTEKFLPDGGRVIRVYKNTYIDDIIRYSVGPTHKGQKIQGMQFVKDTIVYVSERGKVHREDGPALIYPDGEKVWYKHGKRIIDEN
jgi:hypothetical protein